MGTKVTFDATNRLIVVTQAPVSGQVSLDVEVDLYSDMKEDMIGDVTLARNPPAFTQSQGGVETPTGFTGKYFFQNNADGWLIQPYDADHELILIGNMFAADATKPLFVARTGRTILISREFSNLAQGIEIPTSGLTSEESTALTMTRNMTKDLWQIEGCDVTNPMTVTPNSRVAGDVDQTITGDGKTTSTVTRN